MATEDKNKEGVDEFKNSFAIDKMFNTDDFASAKEEEIDLSDYDGLGKPAEDDEFNSEKKKDVDDDEIEKKKDVDDDDDEFNFENKQKNEDDDEDDIDLKAFNKKFNQSFKDEEELKSFLNEKEEKEQADKDKEIYEDAVSKIETVSPLLKLSDYDLMKRSIQHQFMKDGKDLTNDEIQIEIEEEVQSLVDNKIIDIKAESIRSALQKLVDDATGTKDKIDTAREEAQTAKEKAEREELQNKFVELHGVKNFYGVKLDRKLIEETYRDVVSDKFIKELQADKGAIAELALMSRLKEQIFKKASGLTYSDGLKAVLDEFKTKVEKDPVANAQKRGGTGSPANSGDDLIESILYGDTVEE